MYPGKILKLYIPVYGQGEKLYEELLTDKENTLPTHHPKIKIAQVEKFDYSVLLSRIDLLIKNEYLLSNQEVVGLFREIVPEFKSSNGNTSEMPTRAEESQC